MTMPGRGPREEMGVTCELCEWSAIAHDQGEAKVLQVLHFLIKHPMDYFQATGKRPEDAREAYAVQIALYRKKL